MMNIKCEGYNHKGQTESQNKFCLRDNPNHVSLYVGEFNTVKSKTAARLALMLSNQCCHALLKLLLSRKNLLVA
jgi:hypothetical protein